METRVLRLPSRPGHKSDRTYPQTLSRVRDQDDIDVAQIKQNDPPKKEVSKPVVRRKENISVNLPGLSSSEKKTYKHLPGHFLVKRVLYGFGESSSEKFVVKLASGESDLVDVSRLETNFYNGRSTLKAYRSAQAKPDRKPQPPPMKSAFIDWSKIMISDSDFERSSREQINADVDAKPSSITQFSSDNELADPDHDLTQMKRRSSRIALTRRPRYNQNNPSDLREGMDSQSEDEDNQTQKRFSSRPVRRARRKGELQTSRMLSVRTTASDEEWREPTPNVRRSERTRMQTKRNLQERQEDDLSSQSDIDQRPKVLAVKEVFAKISRIDPFRKKHRQRCTVCYAPENSATNRLLVFCQGCTNSYHKDCLGPRASRAHLVTKVGDHLFVLQCNRCIGIAQDKDPKAPHYGLCSSCNEAGPLSVPLRRRLNTKQEQIQREENGGIDPITVTHPDTIDNVENIMFRCTSCSRAWHFHHLPIGTLSEVKNSDAGGLDLGGDVPRQTHLHDRSWLCKDCTENPQPVENLVAWRPIDQDLSISCMSIGETPEHRKQYLVKWKDRSYSRCTWMPGTWVWSQVNVNSRAAFGIQQENQLPRMTVEDAIPEEYHRIDIVFDVRYKTAMENDSEEIERARINEVDTVLVKYTGLMFEDTVWEKPPADTEQERFAYFREAYEDYVRKRHISIPSQATLEQTMIDIRQLDFEKTLVRKSQPSIMSGGEIMQYQLEGLNWLYYQWYRQHNAILADEMGLGKTIQIIAMISTLIEEHQCWPFLIVVPNSTCPNWRREIKKWTPTLRAVCYYGSSGARKLIHDFELFPTISGAWSESTKINDIKAHIVITSYESITTMSVSQSLAKIPWQGLIVDEGHRLKSDHNLIYHTLSKFRIPFKVLMTGTPLQNSARELFNLLQFLNRDEHNAAELEEEYAELTQNNVTELHELLKPYFLRRTKTQVLAHLPPMSQIILPVTMSALQRQVSKSIMSQNAALMKSLFDRTDGLPVKDKPNLRNILMQLRKTLCHPFVFSREIEDRSLEGDASFKGLVEASSKLKLLSIMLPKLQERGHRVLIFSQFLGNLDIIEDFLDGLGMLYQRLDGSMNSLEKQKRIDRFNTSGSPYFAFLLSTRAGGVGINLATADTVIILDPDFNPHQDIQALSRAHRIGQESKVLVFQLMTRSSVEEKILQIGKKKMALDHVLIEAMDQQEDAAIDLESILRHGAAALFDEELEEDIAYDDASVDKLLDRSHIETTKTSESNSADSRFSFARIWANDRNNLEDGLHDSGTSKAHIDIWENILKERQRLFVEEQARRKQELGRGKRKRGNVDYSGRATFEVGEELEQTSPKQRFNGGNVSDEDFQEQDSTLENDVQISSADEDIQLDVQKTKICPLK